MDMRECDLLVVQAVEKYNDMHKYILSVIDVLSWQTSVTVECWRKSADREGDCVEK